MNLYYHAKGKGKDCNKYQKKSHYTLTIGPEIGGTLYGVEVPSFVHGPYIPSQGIPELGGNLGPPETRSPGIGMFFYFEF